MPESVTIAEFVQILSKGVNSDGEPIEWSGFCQHWGEAKQMLEVIRPFLEKKYPIVAGLVITAIEKGGDAVHKDMCG